MKTRIKHLATLFILLYLGGVLLGGCSDNDSSDTPHDPNKDIELNEFTPLIGGIGTRFLIKGHNFGSDASKVKVYFNEKEAAVVNCTNDIIYCLVPRTPGTDCRVKVSIGENGNSFETHFTYLSRYQVTTIAGTKGTDTFKEGTLATATFGKINGIVIDNSNNIFFTHRDGNREVGLLSEQDNMVKLLSTWHESHTEQPTIVPETQIVYVPINKGLTLLELNPLSGWIPRTRIILHPTKDQQEKYGYEDFSSSLASNWSHGYAYCEYDKHIYTRFHNGELIKFDPQTYIGSKVDSNLKGGTESYQIFDPIDTHILYLVYSDKQCIFTYNLKTKEHKLFAGKENIQGWRDGYRTDAEFKFPVGIVPDAEGNLYVSDKDNHCIRMITRAGNVSTIAGVPGEKGLVDGSPEEAMFTQPRNIAISKQGDIYITDGNRVIRKLTIQ